MNSDNQYFENMVDIESELSNSSSKIKEALSGINMDILKTSATEQVVKDIEKTLCPNFGDILKDIAIPKNITIPNGELFSDSIKESINELSSIGSLDKFEYQPVDVSQNPINKIAEANQKNIETNQKALEISNEIKAALFTLIHTVSEIKELINVTKESNSRMEYLTKGMITLAIGTLVFGFISVLVGLCSKYWNESWITFTWIVSLIFVVAMLVYLGFIYYKIKHVKKESLKEM